MILTPRLSPFRQVESGFFQDNDVKTVGKSIRDRVALIKWRRGRTVSVAVPADQGDAASAAQTAPAAGLSSGAMNAGPPPLQEPEEAEADQHSRLGNLPASATSVACKRLYCLEGNQTLAPSPSHVLVCTV